MKIYYRRASTVFDRSNFTITDITSFSPPIPVIYKPEDFFTFYDRIFAFDQNQTNWNLTTQYTLLTSIAAFLEYSADTQINPMGGARQFRIREFLATPLAIFTDSWQGRQAVGMGKVSLLLFLATASLLISH
jgi:hypothetical protein